MILGVLTDADIFLFWVIFAAVLGTLAFLSWFSWKLSHRNIDPCPYTGLPLRRGSDISEYAADRIYRYLKNLEEYDNKIFDLKKASYCPETGRIFPNSITWLESIRVDWSFIQKRYKGHYVSWGSLTQEQQNAVRREHASLSGFNTEFSCGVPQPRLIEPEYAYARPGPLYVDVNTHVLLGWRQVPNTDYEVLIVQKPLKLIIQKPQET